MKQKKQGINGFIVTTRQALGSKESRSLQIAGVSCFGNALIGFGKLLLGILSLSFFTCVSAFYTFSMVIAKGCALSGIVKGKNQQEQYVYYAFSGLILIVASLLYMVYSVHLIFYPVVTPYHLYLALGIATITFTELTINICGVIRERHNHTPLFHAIKMINLASSLICLVLTQTALLSIGNANTQIHTQANGFMGVIMGTLAGAIGIAMIIRIKRLKKENSAYWYEAK